MSEGSGGGASWVRPPEPREVILVAKAGEGVEFPEYVLSALRRYEQELAEQQQGSAQPELEALPDCIVRCGKLEIV